MLPMVGRATRAGSILRSNRVSGTPDTLLHVQRGHGYRLVMDLRGVLIEIGGGLSAKIASAKVEVEGGDAVLATDTGELHTARNAFGGVVPHDFIVAAAVANTVTPGWGDEGNVTGR
jgi:hypothetical protein